jgi:NifB/MoaA-like Fe-S oxidoreductase
VALEKTILDLSEVAKTLAVVPAGQTRFHRNGLPKVDGTAAKGIIETVERAKARLDGERKSNFVFCSDEIYIRAGREIPEIDTDAQLGNGAGVVNKFCSEFLEELKNLTDIKVAESKAFESKATESKATESEIVESKATESETVESKVFGRNKLQSFDIVTGADAYPYIKKLLDAFSDICPNVHIKLHRVLNDFFGHSVTVSGLLTGTDVVSQLKGKTISKTLLFPDNMLRAGKDVFLDGMTAKELGERLGMRVEAVKVDGAGFLERLCKNDN